MFPDKMCKGHLALEKKKTMFSPYKIKSRQFILVTYMVCKSTKHFGPC